MLREVNFVLGVGSVDGVCTTAAVLRNACGGVDVEFCQAFTVDKIDPTKWPANRTVLFVDLAVNNKEKAMTVGFLKRVIAAGHTIFGVLDEHNAEDWKWACGEAGIDFDKLAIKPVSQDKGDIKSSGALLLEYLKSKARDLSIADEEGHFRTHKGCSCYPDTYEYLDKQTKNLCVAADAGDRMDFSTHFGGLVNQAMKSNIVDDTRRVYMAKHFAKNYEPDEKILGWVKEYENILKTHGEVIAVAEDLGLGMVRVDCVGKVVDMTTLMNSLYKDYYVVVVEGEMFSKEVGKKVRQISFGVKPGVKFNVLEVLKNNGIEASGFASKANLSPEDEAVAVMAVRKALPNALVLR